jgi:hypothetical protein
VLRAAKRTEVSIKLELSEAKTLLTHAPTGAARFLGYEITVLALDRARDRHDRRATNGQIGLRVPADVIRTKCRPYVRHGKPAAWAECLHDAPVSTVVQFAQTYRGVANYYRWPTTCTASISCATRWSARWSGRWAASCGSATLGSTPASAPR